MDDASPIKDTEGRAYGRKPGVSDDILTRVGPGTPGGELLRRYWQPIAKSSEATDLPKEIRRFGEDLILFRNKKGEPGLLYPRCVHRGTSLIYGRVEDDGIRCCYHGWKFDNQGNCLEQPCEPNGGEHKEKARQPWYPVVEKHGAIWAYLGPADKQPPFPRFSNFEDLGEDEMIRAYYFNEEALMQPFPVDFNWFQFWENFLDTYHVHILHFANSGDQFVGTRLAQQPDEVKWRFNETRTGILAESRRKVDGVKEMYVRSAEAMMPNRASLPNFFRDGPSSSIYFAIPIDDTNHFAFHFDRVNKDWEKTQKRAIAPLGPMKKFWKDLTPEERQQYPNDYEAQSGQGKITWHSEEHLVQSDIGIAMLRRMWKQQADVVAQGGDPVGVSFDPDYIQPISAAADMEKPQAAE